MTWLKGRHYSDGIINAGSLIEGCEVGSFWTGRCEVAKVYVIKLLAGTWIWEAVIYSYLQGNVYEK